ncbi:MAG: hypothetical protein HKN72_01685, partial [Gemmatimonadetes bacterium]|nr:hypothetical protein [Gemmatimonadota bacterium]
AGTYSVELTVTDKDDGEGTDDLVLTVPHATVGINIKPLEDPNPVSLRGNGTMPVAILGSIDLDVNDINPATLSLGDGSGADTPIEQKRSGDFPAYVEDVDGDGFMDLVTMFSVRNMVDNGDLSALSIELVLRGFLMDGCTNIQGTDTVRPVGRDS